MDITGEKILPVNRVKVWESLHDAELLKNSISGCELLEWVSDDEMKGLMVAKIGPVKAKFDLQLAISNSVPETSYTLEGKSSAGAHGFASGSADIQLADNEEGCTLSYFAQMKLGGRIAQIGSRLVSGTARKLIDGFFDKFVENINNK